ncbi:MAG: murein hydrolase activator EnvC family protein [Lawsonibacter sp.]|nr:peptidoglycan DD-metalloendopeptidase family protein [Oscillospiraceae bacterium]
MEKREKGRVRRWLIRLCSAALVALMVLPVLPDAVVLPASAVTQAEINQMKEDAAALKKQRAELQKQLKAIQADKSKALDQKALLEQQINATQAEINNIAAQITQYDQLIAQKETELAATEEKERAQYELFCKRVREMEEQGEVSYWSILFSSDDFSDLLDNAMMVEEIMDYDNQVMNELIAIREQIEADKTALETARQEQKDAKAEQEAAKAELKSQQAQVDALIAEISGQESQVKAAEAKLQAAANAADAEIRAAEKELASQIANVPSESGFLWPLPGRYNLSSLYGSRKHPVTGKANNHTGIDVPAPSGTPIQACKSGVVTTSTYNNSYGNYVVVSHSDGTSTLYAHMSRRNASKGQTVSQGQVIGYVGTTGSSTGNHLHLEIRVNGSRRDPINYFQSLPLTISGVRIK